MSDVCAVCGEPVLTLFTVHGVLRHLNPTPHPDGPNTITLDNNGRHITILHGLDMPAPPGTGYLTHICPPNTRRKGPACGVCLMPMDRELADREKWTSHPSCDTTDVRSAIRAQLKQLREKR